MTTAGMPVFAKLARQVQPRRDEVALIGSSRLKPSAQVAETVPLVAGRRIQSSRLCRCRRRPACPGPRPGTTSPAELLSTLRIARRKSSDSRMLFSTSARATRRSIIAAATSQLAMMAYCGLVLVCIRYSLVEEVRSSLRRGVLHQHLAGLADAGQQLVRVTGWRTTSWSLGPRGSCPWRGNRRRTRGRPRAEPGFVEVQGVST